MTYSSRMKVHVDVKIYTQALSRSDKFKTGKEQYVKKDIVFEDSRDIIIGRIPVMVNSDLCWMSEKEKGDCEYDHGGYFLIKGAEKVFIAQEQQCLRKLWVASIPAWSVGYRDVIKRRKVHIKLVDTPSLEQISGGEKVLTVYFSVTEIPIWILFSALGVSSDREVVELIDCDIEDTRITNILVASIQDAEKKCQGFQIGNRALEEVGNLFKQCKFLQQNPLKSALMAIYFQTSVASGERHDIWATWCSVSCKPTSEKEKLTTEMILETKDLSWLVGCWSGSSGFILCMLRDV